VRQNWSIGAAALAVGASFAAVISGVKPANATIPDALVTAAHQGLTREQYIARLLATLQNADRSSDGLDLNDIAVLHAQQQARLRAGSIADVLRHDLNGDLTVTRAEIEQLAPRNEASRNYYVKDILGRYDVNGDGTITIAEASKVAAQEPDVIDVDGMMALDPNHDGRLTTEELRGEAESAFKAIDGDRDGRLSSDEIERVAGGARERSCNLPPVPEQGKLVYFGVYGGDSISSAAVGGPDQETNLIDVRIEPGTTPVYLVLTSYESMVWRLSGATGRLTNVVVSSLKAAPPPRPLPVAMTKIRDSFSGEGTLVLPVVQPTVKMSASGVIGVPASKVTIAATDCPHYSYQLNGLDSARLKRMLGRVPDAAFGSYSAGRVALPSGVVTRAVAGEAAPPARFDPRTWREAIRFWPGGLVSVPSQSVSAHAKVEPYEVLPSQMGVSQLVGSGAIVPIGEEKFRVVRPIAHMPPGMGGAHAVTLVFAKGVEVPPGDPGHSCIISEDTGQSLGTTCRMIE